MKKRDIEELKNKGPKELEAFVKDSEDRLRGMRFDLAAGKLKNANEMMKLRRSIARALTFLQMSKSSEKVVETS